MCPSFLATRDEKDSTRGRARVLQELANGSLVRTGGRRRSAKRWICACPARAAERLPGRVDMATYKAEALYQRYRRRFVRRRITRSAGCHAGQRRRRAPWLANASLRVPSLAAAAKRQAASTNAPAAGLRRDELPPLVHRPVPPGRRRRSAGRQPARPRRARRRRSPHPPQARAAMDGYLHKRIHPQVGQAAVRVLEAAGYEVRITPRQVCCGLTWISTGSSTAPGGSCAARCAR